MKIDLFDMEEFIKLNHLMEVTSPVLFQRGDIPHPDGLISNEIFGVTVQKRKTTFAYINLNGYFFHPHVYKAIKAMFRNIDKVIGGDLYYSIDDGGNLVVDNVNGETGLSFLYNNWEKIKWKRSDTPGMRNERVDLVTGFKKNEIFIHYFLVIPPFYRDIKTTSRGGETGDLNKYYSSLIRYASLIKDRDLFGFQYNLTNLNIQTMLVNIYDDFKVRLEKKNGLIRKYLMGKNVDNCTRTVITSPQFHSNDPMGQMTDFEYCAIPISQILSLCNAYVMKWVKDFFDRELFSRKESVELYNPIEDTAIRVRLKNPESIFTDKWIKKMLDTYIRDPDSRFNTIEIPVEEDDKKYYMYFTGQRYNPSTKAEISSIAYRKLTWTDILYRACDDVVKDKHAIITRYPISDEFNLVVAKVRVSSTIATIPVMISGHVYPWYPLVDLDLPKENIASHFVDSTRFPNSYLKGLNGDYDGDQTTLKIIYTQEANAECEKLINSKAYYINSSGTMIRKIGNEATQTFYTLTKEPDKNSKVVPAGEVRQLLDMQPSEYTFDFIVDTFGDTTDDEESHSTKVQKSKYNTNDRVTITSAYMGFKGDTTIGRLFFNKILIEQTGLGELVGYVNLSVDSKALGKFEGLLATLLKDDKIDPKTMGKYITIRDWLGLQVHAVITTSMSINMIQKPKEVEKLHEELKKKYAKELEENNPVVSAEIEKQLVAKTKEVLDDDPNMDFYKSGARGTVESNFKEMFLTRGAIKNTATGKFDVITGSLTDGLDKKNLSPHSNTILVGAYSKSVEPQISGYLAKELTAANQAEMLDDPGTDCGAKGTLPVILTDKNKGSYTYRYIIENEKKVLLSPDVIDKYVGKTVHMRSPMFCIGKHICNVCAGEDIYKLGKRNVGLMTTKVATTCVDLGMKKFHEQLVKPHPIDLKDMLI